MYLSIAQLDKVFNVIYDKMDHLKASSLQFSHKTKALDSFMKLPIAVIGMIAHEYGDVHYAYSSLDLYPIDSNHTVDSTAKLLRDLECVPKYASHMLFKTSWSLPLFDAPLEGGSM
jgi:hypothetical protein